jgi:hypothetical protein
MLEEGKADRSAEGGGSPPADDRGDRVVRIVVGIVAAILVALSSRMPVWQARLDVLQYPGRQLVLTAYGDRLEGDVREVMILNHYVGLKVFDMAELRETVLWLPTVGVSLVLVGLVTFLRRGTWLRRLSLAVLWGVPIGVLADVQFRLHQLGHSMDPHAAFRQEPFTPWVVGKVKVASNVTTTAWPGEALWLIGGAALLLTIGPMYAGFIKEFVTAGKTEEGSPADRDDGGGGTATSEG